MTENPKGYRHEFKVIQMGRVLVSPAVGFEMVLRKEQALKDLMGAEEVCDLSKKNGPDLRISKSRGWKRRPK